MSSLFTSVSSSSLLLLSRKKARLGARPCGSWRPTLVPGTPQLLVPSPTAPLPLPQRRHLNLVSEFFASIKRQVAENKEFSQNLKQLADEKSRLQNSDAVQRAKDAMKAGSQGTGAVMKAVGKGVEAVVENPMVQATGKAVYYAGEAVVNVAEKVSEPVMKTQAAQTIAHGIKSVKHDIVDSSANAFYAEYKPREVRQREREELLRHQMSRNPVQSLAGARGPVAIDENAGSALVMHQSTKFQQAWKKFSEESSLAQSLNSVSRSFKESDNPWIERIRDFWHREESEMARVTRTVKAVDPSFSEHGFLKEATQYLIPEIMECYLNAELDLLSNWTTETAYAKLSQGMIAQQKEGLKSDCKLLDIRGVDIAKMSMMDDEIPIIAIRYTAQEILMFRNKKGELVFGSEDRIETANYLIVFTKMQCIDPKTPVDKHTNGWAILDLHRSAVW